MKLLIDIPEEAYNRIKASTNKTSSDFVIINGTPLSDLTNGEVMQKVFNMSLDEFKRTWGGGDFTDTWWNSKWGE